MQYLRLLATSLLASSCVLSAAAQSPAMAPGWYSSSVTTFNQPTPSTSEALPTKSLPPAFSVTLPASTRQPAKPNNFHVDVAPNSSWLMPAPDPQPLVMQAQTQDPQLLAQLKAQETQAATSCYSLRSYGFTANDLKSPHPRASHETDCTPASSAHLRAIQLPATVKAK
jgi:hypothetical protein